VNAAREGGTLRVKYVKFLLPWFFQDAEFDANIDTLANALRQPPTK